MASPAGSEKIPALRRRRFGVVFAICAHLALLVAFADPIVPALVGLATRAQATRMNLFIGLELVLALACLILRPVLRRRGSGLVLGVVLGWIASFAVFLCLVLVWYLTVTNLSAQPAAPR